VFLPGALSLLLAMLSSWLLLRVFLQVRLSFYKSLFGVFEVGLAGQEFPAL
jgi:hypothetical protein